MKEVSISHFHLGIQEAFLRFSDVQSKGLISNLELRWLLALASDPRYVGDPIVEIGCHVGATAEALATAFPDRLVYTIDCVKTPPTVQIHQQVETPDWSDVCILARDLPNVVYINGDTRHAQFSIPPCGFAFIDGDHTYDAVSKDSHNVRHSGAKCVVFHDALSDARLYWVEVHEYLQRMGAILNIVLIKDTNLAVSYL